MPNSFGGSPRFYPDVNTPKYHKDDGSMDHYAQIDRSMEVPAEGNYREDGY